MRVRIHLPLSFLFLPLVACGDGGAAPSSPTPAQSFLAGTWRGTMTIQPDPTGPQPGAPVSGAVTWTFEVVPQTNQQTFRTTVRSENGWLPITLTSSTSMIPGNTPPAQISTQPGTENEAADDRQSRERLAEYFAILREWDLRLRHSESQDVQELRQP